MIRTAISPRLAIRTRSNGGDSPAPSLRKDAPRAGVSTTDSERDVAMLLPRIRLPLVGQHLERTDEPWARLGRLDDLVDVPAGRGDIRARELGLVRRDQPRSFADGIVRVRDVVLEDDVDRALRSHDRDLRGRPGEVHVATDVLAAHDVVRAAI